MYPSAMSEKRRLRIPTAAELFSGLRGSDGEREAVLLEAIARQPGEALALGPHAGETLEDVLAQKLAQAPPGSAQEALVVRALAALPGPGPALQLWSRFEQASDASVLARIAAALERLPLAWRQEHLTAWLRGPEEPRSRLAANLLADAPSPAVCARTDREDVLLGPFGPEWLAELRGPFRERLHLLWRTRAAEVAEHFALLPPSTQRWLLSQVPGRPEWLHPDLEPAVLCDLLERWDPPAWALEHSDPRVREVAARRGGSPERWRSESEPAVQAAYVGRLRDPGQIVEALESPLWQVRAAASRAAAVLGLREPLRQTLLATPKDEVKAACLEALVTLGDDDWLEANLT